MLSLYLPQPLLPQLDRDLGTSPEVTSLVITTALLGFAVAGLLPEGRPRRTLAVATLVTVAGGLLAAASPGLWLLLPARAGQGLGTGFLVAGGLADIARNMPRQVAGRVTGSMIAGTALGGMLGRVAGYAGLALGWRGAFVLGAAALAVVVSLGLRALPPEGRSSPGAPRPRLATVSTPPALVLAGLGILFVNVGMFDLLPYRLSGPPFHLPAAYADLVYLTYLPASFFASVAGRAVDRYGARLVALAVGLLGAALLLVGVVSWLPAVVLAGLAAITGTSGLHVAFSGTAARYGRAAVGRYLAAYYVGGAAAAPVLAAVYLRGGWNAATFVMSAAWFVVALLAAAGQQPHGAQVQGPKLEGPPPGSPG